MANDEPVVLDVSGRRVLTWGEGLSLTKQSARDWTAKHSEAKFTEITGLGIEAMQREDGLIGKRSLELLEAHDPEPFSELIARETAAGLRPCPA